MNEERPIEKLLRRYATKRRDDAGDSLSMHPATRRLLQGEVTRRYPKSAAHTDKPSVTGLFALLVQRWAFALGVLVVLAITAAVLLPSIKSNSENDYLAQKKLSDDVAIRKGIEPAAPPAATRPAESQLATLAAADSPRNQPASAGNRSRDEAATLSYAVTNSAAAGSLSRFADARTAADSLSESEEAKRFSRSVNPGSAPPTSRALSTPSPARSAGEAVVADSLSVASAAKEDLDPRNDRYNEARRAASPPPAPTSPALSVTTTAQDKNVLARGGGLEKDAQQFFSQSFSNVSPGQNRAQATKAKSEASTSPVLTQFQVQQVGNQLRVIDGDGSTYLGKLNSNLATGPAMTAGRETASLSFENRQQATSGALAGAIAPQQQSSYSWRVEGTNRTLNQNVVFTWNFVETTNQPAATQINTAVQLNQSATTLPSQFPVLLNNSTINGRAQLGPAQQIEVNAVPVKN